MLFKESIGVTGLLAADYSKLARIIGEGKQQQVMVNVRQTAGSMFEYFKPEEAGVFLREDRRVKHSKREFEDVVGRTSMAAYQHKIQQEG